MFACFRGAIAVGLSVSLLASKSRAETSDVAVRESARELGYAGVEAYQAGDYVRANNALSRAYALLRAPSLGLWSARTLVKLGDYAAAAARYREVVNVPFGTGNAQIQNQARIDAQRELSAILPRLAHATIAIESQPRQDVRVWLDDRGLQLDGKALEVELNPGEHRVRAESQGRRLDVRFVLRAGEQRSIPLRFDGDTLGPRRNAELSSTHAASGDAPITRRGVGWIAIGTGSAGILFGAVTGVILLEKKSDLDSNDACNKDGCLASVRGRVDSYNSLRPLSTIGFVAGAALGGVGLALILSDDKRADSQRGALPTQLVVGLDAGRATLRGSF